MYGCGRRIVNKRSVFVWSKWVLVVGKYDEVYNVWSNKNGCYFNFCKWNWENELKKVFLLRR